MLFAYSNETRACIALRAPDSLFGASLAAALMHSAQCTRDRSRSQLRDEKFIMKSVKINCRYKYISDARNAPDAERVHDFVGSQSKSILYEQTSAPCLCLRRHFIANASCLCLELNILSLSIELISAYKLTFCRIRLSSCNIVQNIQENRLESFIRILYRRNDSNATFIYLWNCTMHSSSLNWTHASAFIFSAQWNESDIDRDESNKILIIETDNDYTESVLFNAEQLRSNLPESPSHTFEVRCISEILWKARECYESQSQFNFLRYSSFVDLLFFDSNYIWHEIRDENIIVIKERYLAQLKPTTQTHIKSGDSN